MRLRRLSFLCAVLLAAVLPALAAPLRAAETPLPEALAGFRRASAFAVQGDLPSALGVLATVDSAGLDPERRRVAACMVERFRSQAPVPATASGLDPWSASLLAAYRNYWDRVLRRQAAPDAAERDLSRALSALLAEPSPNGAAEAPPADMEALEPRLEKQLEQRGLHALFGVTSPFRELMLWRQQERRVFDVALPAGKEHVTVEMLDDFSSLGWVGYATCDYYHSAGWTAADRLYCVRPSYDLDSEAFRVSYLAHEGQHFADHRDFPDLEAPELEYRAKLVEIVEAETTLVKLLEAFAANQSSDREQPHPFANRRLIGELSKLLHGEASWSSIPPRDLHAAARRLFDADSASLRRRSAGK
jgi:hypothetical protein